MSVNQTQTISNVVRINDESPQELQNFTPLYADQVFTDTLMRTLDTTNGKQKRSITGQQRVVSPLLRAVGVAFTHEGGRCVKYFDEDFIFENTEAFHQNQWETFFSFQTTRLDELTRVHGAYSVLRSLKDQKTTFFIISSRLLKEMALKTSRVMKGFLGSTTISLIAHLAETIFNRWNYKPVKRNHARCLPILQSNYIVDVKQPSLRVIDGSIPEGITSWFSEEVEALIFKPTIETLVSKEREERRHILNQPVSLARASNTEDEFVPTAAVKQAHIDRINQLHTATNDFSEAVDYDADGATINTSSSKNVSKKRKTTEEPVEEDVGQQQPRNSLFDDSFGDYALMDIGIGRIFELEEGGDVSRNSSLRELEEGSRNSSLRIPSLFDERPYQYIETEMESEFVPTAAVKQAHIDRINQLHTATNDFSEAVDYDADGATINTSSSKNVSKKRKTTEEPVEEEQVKEVRTRPKRVRKKRKLYGFEDED